jgi:hypothetical protein
MTENANMSMLDYHKFNAVEKFFVLTGLRGTPLHREIEKEAQQIIPAALDIMCGGLESYNKDSDKDQEGMYETLGATLMMVSMSIDKQFRDIMEEMDTRIVPIWMNFLENWSNLTFRELVMNKFGSKPGAKSIINELELAARIPGTVEPQVSARKYNAGALSMALAIMNDIDPVDLSNIENIDEEVDEDLGVVENGQLNPTTEE